ncbi:hypothetical protein Pcinc_019173 [Petrolisthes cinctipes]|uniref:Uncharacterized protein n=1 Tax=Petrolisthes cinctipes TaxID=88211 RepID=A0AAE1FQJ0_PETCI|nr:hypothetical protein Pcinc_019173 [Petrolisthes cinctipes]
MRSEATGLYLCMDHRGRLYASTVYTFLKCGSQSNSSSNNTVFRSSCIPSLPHSTQPVPPTLTVSASLASLIRPGGLYPCPETLRQRNGKSDMSNGFQPSRVKQVEFVCIRIQETWTRAGTAGKYEPGVDRLASPHGPHLTSPRTALYNERPGVPVLGGVVGGHFAGAVRSSRLAGFPHLSLNTPSPSPHTTPSPSQPPIHPSSQLSTPLQHTTMLFFPLHLCFPYLTPLYHPIPPTPDLLTVIHISPRLPFPLLSPQLSPPHTHFLPSTLNTRATLFSLLRTS